MESPPSAAHTYPAATSPLPPAPTHEVRSLSLSLSRSIDRTRWLFSAHKTTPSPSCTCNKHEPPPQQPPTHKTPTHERQHRRHRKGGGLDVSSTGYVKAHPPEVHGFQMFQMLSPSFRTVVLAQHRNGCYTHGLTFVPPSHTRHTLRAQDDDCIPNRLIDRLRQSVLLTPVIHEGVPPAFYPGASIAGDHSK